MNRLKVAAAEKAGLDTVRSFREEQERFRKELVKLYLIQDADYGTRDKGTYEVLVEEFVIYLPQNVTPYALRQAEEKIKSKTEVDSVYWVHRLQKPTEFEEVAFSLEVGETSKPFYTPEGIHIIKVIDRRLDTRHETRDTRQTHRYGLDKGAQAAVERLKKEYNYTEDKQGIHELLSKGSTERTLFTLDGKAYTGKDFAQFAVAYPAGTRRQLEAFTAKAVLDYENSRMEEKHPQMNAQLQAHRDSVLIAAITEQEVNEKSRTDVAGLSAYYDTHREDYYWDTPRYQGIVLHCTTKKVAKRVRKFLKQLPEAEWMDAVKVIAPLNPPKGGTHNSLPFGEVGGAEYGLFAEGDNAYVDELVFKKGKATPMEAYPYTAVQGRKLKGPDDWQEVGEQVKADYRAYLQTTWESALLKNR